MNEAASFDTVNPIEPPDNATDKTVNTLLQTHPIQADYGLPSVAIRVNQMLANNNVSAVELAHVISFDLGLSEKILRLCNSSAYGLPRKIGTIKEAITILGLKELRHIIFTIISRSVLNRPFPGYSLETKDLWKNALACATCAKTLAVETNFPDHDLAYIAALLRDVGKVAFDPILAEKAQAVVSLAQKEQLNFDEAETRLFQNSHSQIGQSLAEQWGMPSEITNCIAYHHQPSLMPLSLEANQQRLIAIVHLADIYTTMLGVGIGIDGFLYRIDTRALTVLGLGESDILRFYQILIQQEDAPQKAFETLEAIL